MSIPMTGSGSLAEETDLSLSKRLSLLADPHRRAVLERLDRTAGGVAVETLAIRVAADLSDSAETVDDERRRRVLLALHHNHLPKLADHGLLEYDLDAGIVTAT